MSEKIAVADLVPHSQPMLLVEELVDYTEDSVVCSLEVRAGGLFDNNGKIPASIGLEYMAQTVAVFSGLRARKRNKELRLGFLLGTRKFSTNVAEFSCGMLLTVKAVQAVRSSDGMAAFTCVLEGENVQQTATLTVYEPVDPSKILSGSSS
jgi:predicted hotdog family 3-hydroxylacyl-ACP dehydratase